ncbi:ABC transporter substrate-binding protein [Eubacteriales bacterium OttesenSCG-928-M02]|nr:ABC transporter substrate-binding protein [Eubacteriales bacterium OttesenSCG-928-M02]
MNKRLTALLLAMLMLAVLLVGCSTPSGDGNGDDKEGTRIVKDMKGDEVELKKDIKRVVNLWPSSNSAMLCMGAGDLLVATMQFTKNQPWSSFVFPGIADVPAVSDDVNAEELLNYQPDLVICAGDAAPTYREAGLPAVNLMFSNYDDMKQSFGIMGEIFGGDYVAKAAKWSEMVDDTIAEVNNALKDLKEEDKPVVYYIGAMSSSATYTSTMAAGGIQEAWVTHAGGIYAGKELGATGNDLQVEAILNLNPDVIMIGGPFQRAIEEKLKSDPAWKDIKAVKDGRIYRNPVGLFPWCRFGMESVMQIKYAASKLHPDLYQVDMVKEVQDFYKEFVGKELTEEQAKNMLDGLGPNGERQDK